MTTQEVTKKEFRAYEQVRKSGVTNMFDVQVVEQLSGLNRDTILAVIKQYTELCKKYPNIRTLD